MPENDVAERAGKINKHYGQQPAGNAQQETILNMFSKIFPKQDMEAALNQETPELQIEAINAIIRNGDINDNLEEAHKFLLQFSAEDRQLHDSLCNKRLAQTKNINYQDAVTKQHINELFDLVRNKLFDQETQQQLYNAVFDENGIMRQEFIGAPGGITKQVQEFVQTVCEGQRAHAPYSNKWLGYMVYRFLRDCLFAKMAAEYPDLQYRIQRTAKLLGDTKPSGNSPMFVKG